MNRTSASAAAKLLGLVAVLVFVSGGPLSWIPAVPIAYLVAAATGHIDLRRMARRLLPVIGVAGLMALAGVWSQVSDTRRPPEAAFRAICAGGVLVAFAEITSLTEVFRGMRVLGIPPLLTSSLSLMLRSIEVLTEERRALLRSRAARGGERRSRWAEWRARAGLVGNLLERAVGRSVRVHRAMKARGWSAEPAGR